MTLQQIRLFLLAGEREERLALGRHMLLARAVQHAEDQDFKKAIKDFME